MNWLLINPPMVIPVNAGKFWKRCVPPLALGFANAWLRRHGHNTSIHDAVIAMYDCENVRDNFVYYGAPNTIAGCSETKIGITMQVSNQLYCVKDVIKCNENVTVGGLCPTLYPEEFKGAEIAPIIDINAYSPDWSGFKIEEYFRINVPFSPVPMGKRTMPVLSSIGCSVGCSFCANTNMWPRWTPRPIERVESEIRDYVDRYQCDEIQFADDNLNFNMQHFIDLCRMVQKYHMHWCTPNGLMVNHLNSDIIDIMAESGCYQITLAVDGTTKKSLNLMNKKVRLYKIQELTHRARMKGMFVHGTIVIGMPEETREDIEQGLEFIWNYTDFTSLSVFCAWPIPGSNLYEDLLKQKKIEKKEAWMIDTTRSIISGVEGIEVIARDFQQKYSDRANKRHHEEILHKYGEVIA